ncbi:hypothetical protein, partial [Aeromonas caviae]
IDWIGHTEYSETRIEQLDHIFNLIGINSFMVITPVFIYRHYSAPPLNQRKSRMPLMAYHGANK